MTSDGEGADGFVAVSGLQMASIGSVFMLLGVTLTGALADPTPEGFVTFDEIRRSTFTALAVHRSFEEPGDGPLIVRVNVVGDARDYNLTAPFEWLRDTLDVHLVEDASGVPLYLTRDVLIATSGPHTLGATVRSGMAVEVRHEDLVPCVVVHEILHFLGLRHETEPTNIMYPRCSPGKPDLSTLAPAQTAHLDGLSTIHAVTPNGIHTWVNRG